MIFKKKPETDTANIRAEFEAQQYRPTGGIDDFSAAGRAYYDNPLLKPLPEEMDEAAQPVPESQPWQTPEHYRAIEPMRGQQLCIHLYGVSHGGEATNENSLTSMSLPLASLCAVLDAPLGKVEVSLTVLTHTQSVTLEGKNIESLCYTLSEGQVGALRCYNADTWQEKPKPQDPIITKITLN